MPDITRAEKGFARRDHAGSASSTCLDSIDEEFDPYARIAPATSVRNPAAKDGPLAGSQARHISDWSEASTLFASNKIEECRAEAYSIVFSARPRFRRRKRGSGA